MKSLPVIACALALVLAASATLAAEERGGPAATLAQVCQMDVKGDKKDEWKRQPNATSSVTRHRLSAGGRSFDYTATTGLLVIRNDEDKPIANMGFIAYTRSD